VTAEEFPPRKFLRRETWIFSTTEDSLPTFKFIFHSLEALYALHVSCGLQRWLKNKTTRLAQAGCL
jgi:hypothetical protein